MTEGLLNGGLQNAVETRDKEKELSLPGVIGSADTLVVKVTESLMSFSAIRLVSLGLGASGTRKVL